MIKKRKDYLNYLKRKKMNNDFVNPPYGDQTFYDIISGRGSVRVSVELSMETIFMIFIAFVLAGVVSRILIK